MKGLVLLIRCKVLGRRILGAELLQEADNIFSEFFLSLITYDWDRAVKS